MDTTTDNLNTLRAQVEDQALKLVRERRFALIHSDEGAEVATVRLLAQHGFLTNPELQSAELANAISLNRVFNHVPIDKRKAEIQRYALYVRALEQATSVLFRQLKAVCGLAPVKKTATGRTAAEQVERAEEFLEKARKAYVES